MKLDEWDNSSYAKGYREAAKRIIEIIESKTLETYRYNKGGIYSLLYDIRKEFNLEEKWKT